MDQGQRGREHRTPLWTPGSMGCPTQHLWAVPHMTIAGGYQGDPHMAQAPPAGGPGHGASPAGAESPHDLLGQLSEGIRGAALPLSGSQTPGQGWVSGQCGPMWAGGWLVPKSPSPNCSQAWRPHGSQKSLHTFPLDFCL